jgi:flagellar hook assembly protein FlgD
MSGSTLLKELTIKERPAADVNGTKLYAIWDGKDSGGNLVNDGTYRIVVCDLPETKQLIAINNNVSVVKSVFKLESAAQLGPGALAGVQP